MTLQVSVVVPTHKRPHLLQKCLHALLRQDLQVDAYEIIIVDDAASDETHSLVESMAHRADEGRPASERENRPRIRYAVVAPVHGPAAARNIGWRMARADIIAFTDDDCLPEPDWLREGLAALSPDLAGVSGQVIVPVPACPTDYEKNVSRLEESEFVTANCFYRRSALKACGGFDERFTTAWREDSDLQFKLIHLSQNLGSAPRAKIVHPVREVPWGISLKEQRKSMFDALLFKNHPALYRDRIGGGPPLNYYGVLLSTLMFLIAVLSQKKRLAWIATLLWLGLVGGFTFKRLKHTKHTPMHVAEMLFTSILIPYLSIFWRLYGAVKYRVFFL